MKQAADDTKLDNPVWFSVSETHQPFSVTYDTIKFYHPDYCPFGGFIAAEGISTHIDAYARMIDNFFVVGEKPSISNQLTLTREVECLQMIVKDKIEMEIKENITVLTEQHAKALFELVTFVQPGYFRRKTALLGNYFGIIKDGQLVAVAGERMQMDAFIEVSAVVTHPQYTGHGYAKQLIAHTVNHIFTQQKRPYLHVAATNKGAINLYEKLGFTTRRKMSFWNITS